MKERKKIMKGILKRVEVKEYTTRKETGAKTFKKFEFVCDVEMSDHTIKTLKGSYGLDFAQRYFEYCGVKTKDLIGKEVECILAKRAFENEKGEKRTISFIRYINVLDKDNKPIIMSDKKQEINF